MPEDDWIATPDATEQADEMLLDDLDLIGELTHPLRSRLLHHLRSAHSVAELADIMKAPVTRLYHHINRLEELGLISVIATRRAGVVTERRYRNVARDFRLDERVIASTDPHTFGRAIGSLFDVARAEFQHEVEIGALNPERIPGRATISFSEFSLDEARLGEFLDRLQALMKEFVQADQQSDSDTRWRLFIAGFPLTA